MTASLDGVVGDASRGEDLKEQTLRALSEQAIENVRIVTVDMHGVDKSYPQLPATLIEGLNPYLADQVVVEVLGSEFNRIFAGVIRRDWKRYVEHVSDWEIREYREML
jgi:glutamine synthetase